MCDCNRGGYQPRKSNSKQTPPNCASVLTKQPCNCSSNRPCTCGGENCTENGEKGNRGHEVKGAGKTASEAKRKLVNRALLIVIYIKQHIEDNESISDFVNDFLDEFKFIEGLLLDDGAVELTHPCKYCGQEAEGDYDDLLCEECREDFGHTMYSEL